MMGFQRATLPMQISLVHTVPAVEDIFLEQTALRFWQQVKITERCWLWTGRLDHAGYGCIYNGKRDVRAHRFAYEALIAPIPYGFVLDHVKELCGNRNCVNVAHLEVVTALENWIRAKPTHCKQGHEFTQENTAIYHRAKGMGIDCRVCITCNRAKALKGWHAKRNAEALRTSA